MREIKFRAWHIKSKKMVRIYSFTFNNSEDLHSITYEDGRGGTFNQTKDFILMQSTGLHDKNGKEIFEGDIYEYDGAHGEIAWVAPSFHKIWHVDGKKTGSHIDEIDLKYMQIIGNIHESPELLESK